jgi:hypothetical protein
LKTTGFAVIIVKYQPSSLVRPGGTAGRTGGGKNSGEKIGNTIFMAMIEEMGGEK